ncbi:MAG TPA: protease pro-enzyme activation domain-containing protein [Terriglobales bacterium]|nr:protease pro-enzyme activation domain-containing protein [Terriglobales bacterium]
MPENDRGRVPDSLPLEHMLLQLKRSPEQEAALQQFIDELHTQGSPNFHHWLTAQEFGERYGVAPSDLDAVTAWLESHGFQVNVVYPSGMLIDFSGTAGQVGAAFQTEIHHIEFKGERHLANMSDPRVPAALAPVISGVVSLHDFRPHALHRMRRVKPEFTFTDFLGGINYAVVPADLATIYNLNPVFASGISGQGQTIVLIEDTDVYRAADWSTFRSTFGLSKYSSASFTQVHPPAPAPTNNCGAPGVIAPNDAEAILDAEWASAAAPSAAIEMAACADTSTTFGGLIALQNLINASTAPPSIMSISYGQCETVNGAAANAAYNSAYQQAVAEGVSIFVAAGDSGAAGCDNSAAEATHGIGVNAFASTPYNVAVGGTDFSDTFDGTNDTYWSLGNTADFGSALFYIPEIPWNDSCAGGLLSAYLGYFPTYGPSSLCNDPLFGSFFMTTVAGGGGPSQCATGTPSTSGVVSGSCAGWPKPSWQSVFGNPSDGVRDTPDVSLFAADGLWSHFYIFCWSDTANGGAACGSDPSTWSGAGGTSFSSPILAGIQALINQKAGGPQGNPAPVYYQLAAAEYGSAGSTVCISSNGTGVSPNCTFYDVTFGDMDVSCVGPNCYLGGGSVGVLSTSNAAFAPAYGTTTGWDFATGIGTINAANLVNNWPVSGPPQDFTISASPASLSITQGDSGSSTISITPQNGFSGSVSFAASGLPSGVTASFDPASATTSSTLKLTVSSTAATGTANVTITGTSGSLTRQAQLTITVNPAASFTLSASPSALNVIQGGQGSSTVTVNPLSGFSGTVALSASGLPSGVTASFNPASTTTSSTLTLAASETAAVGTATVTVTGTSGSLTQQAQISLSVNPAPSYTLSASPGSLTIVQGSQGFSTIAITPLNGFSGTVALSASGLPGGVTASFNPATAATSSTLTFAASGTAAIGTTVVTITGTSGSLTRQTQITLTVNPPPSYTLSASPSSLNVIQGGQSSSTITINPLNGFSGTVALSASGLPSGVTASFNPASTTGTSTLTFTAGATAVTGSVIVTITGTSGSLTASTTISLTVTLAPDFYLSASPTSMSIARGSQQTTNITVVPVNGFNSNVTFSVSGLPKGVSAAFTPNPATSTSTLTLTTSNGANVGTSTVTITGASGALRHQTTISLTVHR